jgi:hypothetical protein
MIQETLIGHDKWRDAWLWYRGAPHQQAAINKLYAHILELPGGSCLLSRSAEWFEDYRGRDKLLHSAMHTDGE